VAQEEQEELQMVLLLFGTVCPLLEAAAVLVALMALKLLVKMVVLVAVALIQMVLVVLEILLL